MRPYEAQALDVQVATVKALDRLTAAVERQTAVLLVLAATVADAQVGSPKRAAQMARMLDAALHHEAGLAPPRRPL